MSIEKKLAEAKAKLDEVTAVASGVNLVNPLAAMGSAKKIGQGVSEVSEITLSVLVELSQAVWQLEQEVREARYSAARAVVAMTNRDDRALKKALAELNA